MALVSFNSPLATVRPPIFSPEQGGKKNTNKQRKLLKSILNALFHTASFFFPHLHHTINFPLFHFCSSYCTINFRCYRPWFIQWMEDTEHCGNIPEKNKKINTVKIWIYTHTSETSFITVSPTDCSFSPFSTLNQNTINEITLNTSHFHAYVPYCRILHKTPCRACNLFLWHYFETG